MGIATWYWTYKSFRARARSVRGRPVCAARLSRPGPGQALLAHLAAKALAAERLSGMAGAGLERAGDRILKGLGAQPLKDWITYRLEGEALEKLAS